MKSISKMLPGLLALAGLAARTRARVLEIEVPHHGRRAGATSLNLPRLSRLALRAARDLGATARRARRT